MKFWWDGCNKWLYLGPDQGARWVILLDQWLLWLRPRRQGIRHWCLLGWMWDNGAWWAFDMQDMLILGNRRVGSLRCFFEFTVLGVGVRRYYSRKVEIEIDDHGVPAWFKREEDLVQAELEREESK